MELDSLDWELAVAQTHDYAGSVAIGGPSADFQIAGQVRFADDERVIAGGGEWRVNSAKDGSAVVLDRTGFAVHERSGAHDLSAESRANGLMSEADAEHGALSCEVADESDADAGVLRSAGAGRNYDALGGECFDLINGDFVVAADFDARA